MYPKFVDGVRGYGVVNRALYLLTDEEIVYRLDRDGRRVEPVLEDPLLGRSLFRGMGAVQIRAVGEDALLFLGEKGELLTNRLPYQLIDQGVLGVAADARHHRVACWQRHALATIDFSKEPVTNAGFEPEGTLRSAVLHEDGWHDMHLHARLGPS